MKRLAQRDYPIMPSRFGITLMAWLRNLTGDSSSRFRISWFCFFPEKVFFRAAMDVDPELIEYAVARKVMVTSPITLISLLRAVPYGWNQQNLAENARKISVAGKQLFERLCVMTAHVDNLGRKLDGAVKSYKDRLSSMEKRVFPAGRRTAELDRTLAAGNFRIRSNWRNPLVGWSHPTGNWNRRWIRCC